jgi:DNA-binding transcriptional MerR regulator
VSLRSGQLAAAGGVGVQTLRYYERRGLLPDPVRSPGGHRLYPPDTVTVLRAIKAAQRLGFTLDEVADLLERPTGLQEPVRAKLTEIDHRIEELLATRDTLAAALRAGCDDLVACAAAERCPVPFP